MVHLLLEIFLEALGGSKHEPTSISPWVGVVLIILAGAVIGLLCALALR